MKKKKANSNSKSELVLVSITKEQKEQIYKLAKEEIQVSLGVFIPAHTIEEIASRVKVSPDVVRQTLEEAPPGARDTDYVELAETRRAIDIVEGSGLQHKMKEIMVYDINDSLQAKRKVRQQVVRVSKYVADNVHSYTGEDLAEILKAIVVFTKE